MAQRGLNMLKAQILDGCEDSNDEDYCCDGYQILDGYEDSNDEDYCYDGWNLCLDESEDETDEYLAGSHE
jgi:hypothetical protein